MSFELVVVQGRSLTSTIKLGAGVTTIGRHGDCQLRIKSSQVSRRHCEVFEKKGHLLVKELGSSNGTLVNGERLQGQRVLEPGDELTIGPVLLRVASLAAPSKSKPASSPGDTAVSAPVSVAAADDPDSFVIDLDEPTPSPAPVSVTPTASAPKAEASGHHEEDIADFLMDLPIDEDETTVTTNTQPSPVAANVPDSAAQARSSSPGSGSTSATPRKDAEVKHAENEHEISNDAVADFLLDIKLDEE